MIALLLDELLHARGLTLTELAGRTGISAVNLSILKTGKGRLIRFSTLEAICKALSCQPADVLAYMPQMEAREARNGRANRS